MMKLKYLLLLFLTFVFISSVNALDISSQYAIMYNLDEDKILFEKESNERVQIASLTKIMTAIVSLENIDNLDENVILTSNDFKNVSEENLVTAGYVIGQTVTYRDLLYGLLLPSGAECAKALANNVAQNEDNFVLLMNQKAKELGLKNTNFTNAIGLDDEDNYSSAYDVALMFKYALSNKTFKEILTTKMYTSSDNKVTMKSTILTSDITGDYMLGGKTGTTTGAGLCLASIAKDGESNLMLVTLGALYDKKGKHNLEDAKTIYEYYIENYDDIELLNQTDVILTLKTKYAKNDNVKFYLDESLIKYLPNNVTKEDLTYKYSGTKIITTNMAENTRLGTLKIYYDDQLLIKQPIILEQKQQIDFIKYLKSNKQIFILIIIIIIVLIVVWKRVKKFSK